MKTDAWIFGESIYCPRCYTGCYVLEGKIFGAVGYTGYHFLGPMICNRRGDYTGFRIDEDGMIYGPSTRLPWARFERRRAMANLEC